MARNTKKPRKARSQRYRIDPVWNALVSVSHSVAEVTKLPALVIPYLQNAELMAAVPDRPALDNLLNRLAGDVQDMSAKLRAINEQHQDTRGPKDDPDTLMRYIQIHEQYMAWAGEYDDLVMPSFTAILEIFEAAGADTISLRSTSTATAIVRANQ